MSLTLTYTHYLSIACVVLPICEKSLEVHMTEHDAALACMRKHIHSMPYILIQPGLLQDPSYDPYGFAKVATRTASSQAGAAAACPGNVQKFFQTIFDLGLSSSGLGQINQVHSSLPCALINTSARDQLTAAGFGISDVIFIAFRHTGVSCVCC